MKTIVYLIILIASLSLCNAFAEDNDPPKAVYDYNHIRCEIKGNKAIVEGSARITILDSRGNDYADISFTEDKFTIYKKFEYKIVDQSGAVLKSGKKGDFDEYCGFGASYAVYDDNCSYFKDFDIDSYPYTIEWSYKYEDRSLFNWHGVYSQHYIPVTSFSYELTAPSDLAFAYKTYGLDLEPIESIQVGSTTYLWRADSIPAMDDIDNCPDGFPERGVLELVAGNFKFAGHQFSDLNWKNIGLWYNKMCADRKFKDIAKISDPDFPVNSNIETIYNWTKTKIRYVSIPVGTSGWQPYPADFTRENKYGDCKDQTNILVELLRNSNIEAYPALVLTRGGGKLDTDFPNFGFNHVFTMAISGSDTIWMDPTCEKCPLGQLPSADEYIPVLVASDSGGVLTVTPSSKPEDNRYLKETDIYIKADNTVKLNSKLTYTGNYCRFSRNSVAHMDSDELYSMLYSKIDGGRKKYIVDKYEISNLDDYDKPFIIDVAYSRKKKIDKIGNKLFFNPFIFEMLEDYQYIDVEDREYPLDFGYPKLKEHILTIHCDSSLKCDSVILPPADSLINDFGSVSVNYKTDGSKIVVNMKRTFNQYTLRLDQFEAFAEQQLKIKEMVKKNIKFYQ